jgi:polyether ionophore transport system permease protein
MTATVAAPRHRLPEPARPRSAFTGTLGLLRLCLRRDRIVLPLWVLLFSLPLAPVYIGSIESVYATAAQRAMFAATIMASPAQRAVYGNVYNDSIGAVGIWKAGAFHTLIAIAIILTVIRHTRAEEEAGRTELIDSTAVGRYAGLTAVLLLASGAAVATGLIATVSLLTTDVPRSGSLAFGLALACSGLVFTALAAVAAQLGTSARTARGIAFAALGTFFALRAVGDAGSGELSWFSPLGWSLQVRPYAGDRIRATEESRRRQRVHRRTSWPGSHITTPAWPHRAGVAPTARHPVRLDGGPVPVRAVDRQHRARHRRRDR